MNLGLFRHRAIRWPAPLMRLGLTMFLTLLAAGLTAGEIHEAAESGDLARVKTLLAANPTVVNERDREQKTPLHYAAAAGQLAVVESLIAAKAEVNARSSQGLTPMYLAKGLGKTAVANLLAKHGGTVEIVKPTRTVPVPKAAPPAAPKAAGSGQPMPVLQPSPPIIEAARTNGLAALQAILSVNPQAIKETDSNRWTALHHAAEAGRAAAAALLLKSGAAVDARGLEDVTPLHIAARRGDQAVAALLLSGKANPNARTAIQATPLMLAAAAGKMPDMVKLLFTAGAEVNSRDKYGNSALVLAAALPQPDGVAEMLLRAGAEPNVQERASGFAALHHAVLRGHRNLVQALLAAKADPNLATVEGDTPLSLALFESQAEIAALLRSAGAQVPPEPELSALERGLVEQYRGYYSKLASSSFADLRRVLQERMPTQAEIGLIFSRGASAAWEKVEAINRDEAVAWGAANRYPEDRERYLAMIRNGARAGDYLRIETRPPSAFVAQAKAQRIIPAGLPVLQLEVKRRGGEKILEGDYYRVGERWVLLPPLTQVFPELSRP